MKRFFIITSKTLTLLAVVIILLFSSAPYLLNTLLLPHLLSTDDNHGITILISHLTPWSLAGNISLGETQAQTTSGHFHIDYQPSELIRGEITAITLDGVTVRLVQSDGKLSLQNFSTTADNSTEGSTAFSIPALPLMTEALFIRNCQIMIEGADHLTLPFSVQGTLKPQFREDPTGGFRLDALQAEMLSEGFVPVVLKAKLEFSEEVPHLSINARLLESSALSQLLALPQHLQLSGPAQLDADIRFTSDFTSIPHIDAQLQFPGLALTSDIFSLTSSEQTPLSVTVSGSSKALEYTLKNIAITTPSQVQANVQGTFLPTTGELTGKGSIQADILNEPVATELYGIVMPDNVDLTMSMRGDKQQLQFGQSAIQFGAYTLSAQMQKVDDELLVMENVQIASVFIPGQDMQIEDISSSMQIVLNPTETTPAPPGKLGKIALGKIRYRKENLAGLTATIEQTAEGVKFAGEVKSHLGSPLRLDFTGVSTTTQPLALTFNLPKSNINNKSLPSFIKLPSGLTISGKVSASGTLDYFAGAPTGNVTISLGDGELDLKEKKIHLSGITTEITLPTLPQLSSRSSQQLQIAVMNIGNLNFSDGKIFFRIEDQQTLFIEKSRFTWCNGKVESGSLQISLTNPELSTTLYCDRLEFSSLLSQLGISDTEGDGSLNGRLPLHFTGKQMVFDDGFLFSTPGNSGIVRFNNTAMLRQGLPDMGQAEYLEYSMQAMENFSYNWTKLTFNSVGDDLLISMQIDGKPAAPLPFSYRSGQLVSQAEGQGIQHPIRLDVNFHLPFAQMFKYGRNMQKIMENMQ